jgi:hypothetical protein
VVSFLILNISSSISSPSKDRGAPSKIKVNGADTTADDDLFHYMMQNFSPDVSSASSSNSVELSSKSETKQINKHHREKRFIWITKEKRVVLPPGTQLVLTPTLGKLYHDTKYCKIQTTVKCNIYCLFYLKMCFILYSHFDSHAFNALPTTWNRRQYNDIYSVYDRF